MQISDYLLPSSIWAQLSNKNNFFSQLCHAVVVVVVRPSLSTMTNDITGLNKTWCDESCCG